MADGPDPPRDALDLPSQSYLASIRNSCATHKDSDGRYYFRLDRSRLPSQLEPFRGLVTSDAPGRGQDPLDDPVYPAFMSALVSHYAKGAPGFDREAAPSSNGYFGDPGAVPVVLKSVSENSFVPEEMRYRVVDARTRKGRAVSYCLLRRES